jgi:competence protein ComEC
MTRAGLVAGMSLAAWYYGRKFHPVVLLSLAAAITVLMRPAYLTGDLGWQLSFAAFAGVMLLGPLMQRYFFGEAPPSTIRQILGETVAAQIATLPILIFAFGHFSNVALIANLLILPLVPLAMLLTFVAGIAGMVLPVIGLPAQWLLSYMVAVAEYVAHLPWAQTTLQINGFVVAAYYIVLLGIGVYMWQRTRFNLREANIVE